MTAERSEGTPEGGWRARAGAVGLEEHTSDFEGGGTGAAGPRCCARGVRIDSVRRDGQSALISVTVPPGAACSIRGTNGRRLLATE